MTSAFGHGWLPFPPLLSLSSVPSAAVLCRGEGVSCWFGGGRECTFVLLLLAVVCTPLGTSRRTKRRRRRRRGLAKEREEEWGSLSPCLESPACLLVLLCSLLSLSLSLPPFSRILAFRSLSFVRSFGVESFPLRPLLLSLREGGRVSSSSLFLCGGIIFFLLFPPVATL